MPKYRIVETNCANGHNSVVRSGNDPMKPLFLVQRRFLGMWFTVDYEYYLESAQADVDYLLKRSTRHKKIAEARTIPPKVVGEYE